MDMGAEVAARRTVLDGDWTLEDVQLALDDGRPSPGSAASWNASEPHAKQDRHQTIRHPASTGLPTPQPAGASASPNPPETPLADIGPVDTNLDARPTAAELLDWVRSVALDAMADCWLEKSQIAASGNVSARIRERLLERADEWLHPEGPPEARIGPPPHVRPGECNGRACVVIERPAAPAIVVQVDGTHRKDSVEMLRESASRGAISIWVRWGQAGVLEHDGVFVIDVTC